MKLTTQRRIAAQLLKCGEKRVWFDPESLAEIKEAITKNDIRNMINHKAIQKRHKTSISRCRARQHLAQRKKGRRQGQGSRKGTASARMESKRKWINAIRAQRRLLKSLRDHEKIALRTYHSLYAKAKGGFFRSRKHIQLYLEEHDLIYHAKTQEKAKSPAPKKA